jgi:hypothetical protein
MGRWFHVRDRSRRHQMVNASAPRSLHVQRLANRIGNASPEGQGPLILKSMVNAAMLDKVLP